MNPLRTIVCPIELSECSARALRLAKTLADLHGADLAVVAVRQGVDKLPQQRRVAGPALDVAAGAAAWEDSVWRFVHDAIGAAHVRVLAGSGPIVPAILAEAARLEGDLIVMCAHGGNGFGRGAGSTARSLINTAPCPVLALPGAVNADTAPEESWHTVLCGIDGSASSHRVLREAERLAERWRSRLVVAHVLPDTASRSGPERRAACERLIPAHLGRVCEVRLVIAHGLPHEELGRLAAAWNASLIVVGRGGGVAQRLIGHVPCGVLTVPQPLPSPIAQPASLFSLPVA